jgi:hypothetical protein
LRARQRRAKQSFSILMNINGPLIASPTEEGEAILLNTNEH